MHTCCPLLCLTHINECKHTQNSTFASSQHSYLHRSQIDFVLKSVQLHLVLNRFHFENVFFELFIFS